MLVTSMTPGGRAKMAVEIDEEMTFVLPCRELERYGIGEGSEIPQEVWTELVAGLRGEAVKKCGSLLRGMDYTESGLCTRLEQAGYPPFLAREVTEEMKSAGYVDDRRYAENYLCCHMRDRSRLRMQSELRQKGIPPSLLEEVYSAWESANEEQILAAETAQIHTLLRKRGFDPGASDRTQEEKQRSFLRAKGYSEEVIRASMRSFEGGYEHPAGGS